MAQTYTYRGQTYTPNQIKYYYREGQGAGFAPTILATSIQQAEGGAPYGYTEITQEQAKQYAQQKPTLQSLGYELFQTPGGEYSIKQGSTLRPISGDVSQLISQYGAARQVQNFEGLGIDTSGGAISAQSILNNLQSIAPRVEGMKLEDLLAGKTPEGEYFENIPGVGTNVSLASLQERIKNEEGVAAGTMRNVGTEQAPMYVPVGSAGDLQLQGVSPQQQLQTPSVQAQIQQQGLTPNVSTLTPTPTSQVLGSQGATGTAGYTVKTGDNLSQIAQGYPGITWQQIYEANKDIIGDNPNLIKPGQVLKIPGVSGQTGQTTIPGQTPPIVQLGANNGTPGGTTPPPSGTISPGTTLGSTTGTDAANKAAEDIYTKYGIDARANDWLNYPEQSFETLYSNLYTTLGLADTKKLIDDANREYETAVGNINENPWLSEAGRTGKIGKLNDKYERTMTRLNTAYDRGTQEARDTATIALNASNQNRQFKKDELDYYIKRAEADIQAQQTTSDKANQYRYSNIKEVNGGLYNMDTNSWVVASKETTNPTKDSLVSSAISLARPELEKTKGSDGYVDPNVYMRLRSDYASAIGSVSDFDNTFASLLSPQERDRLGVGKESYTPSTGSSYENY